MRLYFWALERLCTYVQLLTYAYDRQMHRVTRTAIIPHHSNITVQFGSCSHILYISLPASGMKRDGMKREVASRHMPHWLLQRVELMKAAISSHVSRAQPAYKHSFCNNVRQESILRKRGHKFVNGPKVPNSASDAANEMTNRQYDWLGQYDQGLDCTSEHRSITYSNYQRGRIRNTTSI